LAIELARSADGDRCENVIILDLNGLSTVTDYFVIATGTSDRQLRTVGDHILELTKAQGIRPIGVDGYEFAHWILLDFGSIVVHLFAPSYRELYDLELLWGDAPQIRWQRRTTKKRKPANNTNKL